MMHPLKSTKFVIQGNYSEEGATGLGIGGNILLGIFGVDIAADVRDLIHNFTHWEWSWGHGGEVVLNGMGLLPFVGVVKNLKYSDEVADIAKNAESIDDLIKGINKIGGFKDVAGNPLVIKKLADGSYEMLDASGNLINKIDDMPGLLEQMGVKIGKGPEVPKGTGEVSEVWLNPKWKWGNPASRPTYGHSFLDHGKKVTDRQLIDRARSEGHQIGKWLDDQAAADFAANIAKRGPGAHYVDLPSDVKGRCFLPDGTEIVPDRAIIVVKKDGSLTTFYPYSSKYPTTKSK